MRFSQTFWDNSYLSPIVARLKRNFWPSWVIGKLMTRHNCNHNYNKYFHFSYKKEGKKMKIVRNFLNIENRFASAATTFGWSAIFHWSANGLIPVGQYKFNCKRSSKTIATQNHGKALVNWVKIMEKRLKLNRNRWKKLTHWQRNPIERKQLEKH